jgi:hypothetical protein
MYLSGKGTDDAVNWDFMVSSGAQAGVWSTLPVPSNWDLHGFGTLAYGFSTSTEVGTYRRAFELPADWAGKQIFIVFEGSMTDTAVTINGMSAGPVHQGAFYRFKYNVTGLVHPGTNQIEVVVSEQSANTSVNAAEREARAPRHVGRFRCFVGRRHRCDGTTDCQVVVDDQDSGRAEGTHRRSRQKGHSGCDRRRHERDRDGVRDNVHVLPR